MSPTSQNGSRYNLFGPKDGSPLILIHGVGLNRLIWRGLLPAFSRDHRVLTYDLHGHGKSEPPPRPASLQNYARQLLELMDELAIEKAAIAGFSLGGMINRRFAQDYPERVQSLVILNAVHARSPEQQAAAEQRVTLAAAQGPGATVNSALKRWLTPTFHQNRPEELAQIRRWVMANDPLIYPTCCAVLAKGAGEIIRPTPAIEHPTLVITCENDSASTPAMARAIAAEIEGADLQIIPTLQHLGLMEAPDLFTQPIIEFLQRQVD